MEYWNSTQNQTSTGRPVDAFLMPLAPFPAARPDTYKYYGYSSICNLLDYTCCSVPVLKANKEIDTVDTTFQPMSELDRKVMDTCEFVIQSSKIQLMPVGR